MAGEISGVGEAMGRMEVLDEDVEIGSPGIGVNPQWLCQFPVSNCCQTRVEHKLDNNKFKRNDAVRTLVSWNTKLLILIT